MANNITKTELEEENNSLKAANAELQARLAKIEEMLANMGSQKQEKTTQTVSFTMPSTDVVVVYMSDSLGYASISNMELHFNKYGEKFTLTRYQFDELVGKYRSWFDKGILAVSYDNVDVAAMKSIKTDKEYSLTADKLESIGRMNATQLEELWNNTDNIDHKKSIVSFYKRMFIEGTAGYRDRIKIDLLNRLTDGAFDRESDELSGRYKIEPTKM